MKKLLSIFMVAILVLSLVPAVYAAEGEPFFTYVSNGNNSKGSFNRYGQNYTVRMGNNKVWADGWENIKTGTFEVAGDTAPSGTGSEGVLPPSGDISGDTYVYWVKTAVSPKDATAVYPNSGDSSKKNYIPTGTDAATPSYVNDGHANTNANHICYNGCVKCAVPRTYEGSTAWELKVRFDDYNAIRYLVSPMLTDAKDLKNLLKYEKDGKVYVNSGGTWTEIDTYTAGTWYDVKLVYHFTHEKTTETDKTEYFDVYINGVRKTNFAVSPYTLACEEGTTWTKVSFMAVDHRVANRATLSEVQWSNSYLYSAKAYTTDTPAFPIVDSDYNTYNPLVETGLYKTTNAGRTTDAIKAVSYLSNYRVPSATEEQADKGYKFTGVINPAGFEGLNHVYMMQTWGKNVSLGILSRGFQFNHETYKDVVMETKVRFDDKNIARRVFMFREYNSSDQMVNWHTLLKFTPTGITADYQSSASTRVIGDWETGVWYTVKVVIHTENNLYDVYVDNQLLAKDMYLPVAANKIRAVFYIYHESGEVETPSTSFAQYAKIYYDEESTYQNPASHIKVSGFKKLNTETENYEDATGLEEGKYALELDIFNNEKDTVLSPTVILAFYKGDRLVDVDMQAYSAEYPTNITRRFTTDVKFSGNGEYSLKAFMWKDGSIEPMNIELPTSLVKTVSE